MPRMTISSRVPIGLGSHHVVSEPAASPSGAIVSAFRMRICQVDDTRGTLRGVYLPSAQFAQHLARLAHVKRIQALRKALEDFCQQWRSLAATAVSFQLASQARGGAQLQRP